MIYLIGGIPTAGKSTLAALILERHHISIISTDVIRNFLDFSPTQLGILELPEAERAKAFYPYLYKYLRILGNHYPDYVVEGDIFTPTQVLKLQEKINLKCCFLGMSGFSANRPFGDSRWANNLSPEEQEALPEKLIAQSRELEKSATTHHFPYIDVFPDKEAALEKAYAALFGE